ncbi:D-fructose 1,6-bisphosphatase [Algoriphagus aquaeductus]|uniref:Fructose-1,6-bisphosphatase class 1 n=1 Tax=Algoriphagus aquaeductus TaxID=475299 RepID=A0A326RXH5_9BACT|nr:class 1 fructose-bisphosphatase [Algoriphagus aquaeductus]PZV82987.1 D-fructose 1,6-bisphosphatase [Algoriphagus aquaeductus]
MKTSPFQPDQTSLAYSVGITLDRFIKLKQSDFPFASGELSQLLRDIVLAAKIVNRETNRAGLANIGGAFGQTNVQGEEQQKLDVIANIRFMRALSKGGEVCAIVSEEEDAVIDLQNNSGKYVVAIDPLDGSSNIDVNISIGTIFSIYRRKSPIGSPIQLKDIMQPGREQVAAGYVLYGSSTMLVYTTGCGVNGFTYENSLGEFFLSHPDIQAPKTGNIYSINEGLQLEWEKGIAAYIQSCKERKMQSRYIGSLVADFHRNLLKGGIYLYPATQKNPSGKLRLLYEANALAFIIEQAGGKASDGKQRILDVQPESLHQRTPLLIGSAQMVEEVEQSVVLHSSLVTV